MRVGRGLNGGRSPYLAGLEGLMEARAGLAALLFMGAILLPAGGAAENVAKGSFSTPRNDGFQVGKKFNF